MEGGERRLAAVTGAGRGIGAAIAGRLAADGMAVALGDLDAEAARTTAQAIGPAAAGFALDVSDRASFAGFLAGAEARFGRLDILVNNAGGVARRLFADQSERSWRKHIDLNLVSMLAATSAAIPIMVRGGRGGAIVNIADLAAFETWPAYVPHTISKAGVVQMTRALARALAPRVRVNAIAPGAVLLPESWDERASERLRATTPLQQHGSPDDVARAMLYLLDADFATGETLVVDGGRHVRT